MNDGSISVKKLEKDEEIYEEETEDVENSNSLGYDFGEMTETMKTYDVSINRGKFTANDVSFKVRPVTAEEFDSYMPMLNETIALKNSEEKEMCKIIIAKFSLEATKNQFSESNNQEFENENPRRFKKVSKLFKIMWQSICDLKTRFVNFTCYIFFKNHIHYKRFEHGRIIAKWVEKLVSVNGKKVKFYDLERKYNLSKKEIAQLLNYINELSGFGNFFD